jgi:hypothetical protein
VGHLQEEGRFRFMAENGSPVGWVYALRQLVEGEAERGHTVWASFNWIKQIDLEQALSKQKELTQLVPGKSARGQDGRLRAGTRRVAYDGATAGVHHPWPN